MSIEAARRDLSIGTINREIGSLHIEIFPFLSISGHPKSVALLVEPHNRNYNIDDVLYKKYYKDLDPSFKRLRIYSDRHTFENRNYYYSKKLKQIRIFKQTADKGQYYYNLVPAIINKKKAFSCVADSGKTVIVFVDLIVDHEQED